MHSYQLTGYNVRISECDNSLMTAQQQLIIVGVNCIRPKQRLITGRIQHDLTSKERETKNVKKYCHFCNLCYFLNSKGLENRENGK